jgi:hypothetical protein
VETLERYETGMSCIETAHRNKLRLIPSGTELDIRPISSDYDKDQVRLVIRMLKAKRSDVVGVTSDPEAVRKALCEAQEALSDLNSRCSALLDRLDRLEQIYRMLFPQLTGCINGDKGCPGDAVMLCDACCKERHG